MKKQNSSSVGAQDLNRARQDSSEHDSMILAHGRSASLAASGLLCMMLIPALAAAAPRVRIGPGDPSPLPAQVPTVIVSDASVAEGNQGSSMLRFKVQVYPVSAEPVTISYRILDHSARCCDGDFQAITGSVTVPANVSLSEIPVTVYGDRQNEADENLTLTVDQVSNAIIGQGVANGTIVNDDYSSGGGGGGGGGKRRLPFPEASSELLPGILPDPSDPPGVGGGISLRVLDASIDEGNAGCDVLGFVIELSEESATDVTVSYRLVDCSASCSDDYQSGRGTITIPAHRRRTVIPVMVFGDGAAEMQETLQLVAENANNVWIERETGTGTIVNDDLVAGGSGGGGGASGPPRKLPISAESAATGQANGTTPANSTLGALKVRYR